MLDSQFLQLRQIRKKYGRRMKKIATALQKAATQAIELEEKIRKETAAVMLNDERVPIASFTPEGSIDEQIKALKAGKTSFKINLDSPDFTDIERLASTVLEVIDSDAKDTSIVISNEMKPEYARKKWGLTIEIPKEWNPATHYMLTNVENPVLRPITPSWPLRDSLEYKTPAGGWIIQEVDTAESTAVSP